MNKLLTNAEALSYLINENLINAIFSNPITNKTSYKKVKIRKLLLKNIEQYQIERFENTKVYHQNTLPSNINKELANCIASFKNAEVQCEGKTFFFMKNNKGNIRALIKNIKQNDMDIAQNLLHNKSKDYLLPINPAPEFLKKLNFFTDDGQLINSKYNKFRQINKYIEFIETIMPQLLKITTSGKTLEIVDFGCGKAYLSFALYYYLVNIKKMAVNICGLDLKQDVIDFSNKLANECDFKNLSFKIGDIGHFNFSQIPDMVISLHACNTATDLALAKAIKSGTKIIFAAPCCQHELNTQLRQNKEKIREHKNILSPILDYGIMTEKFSSLLTDTLRAKILESVGYKVSVEEFIETEHTPKNILIKAIKIDNPSNDDIANFSKSKTEIDDIKKYFLIDLTLENLLKNNDNT